MSPEAVCGRLLDRRKRGAKSGKVAKIKKRFVPPSLCGLRAIPAGPRQIWGHAIVVVIFGVPAVTTADAGKDGAPGLAPASELPFRGYWQARRKVRKGREGFMPPPLRGLRALPAEPRQRASGLHAICILLGPRFRF